VQITRAETIVVEIPFPFPQTGTGIGLNAWRSLEFALVRLEDDRGNVGWGEGFGYSVVDATKAVFDRLLAPRLLAAPVQDIAAWNLETQRALHLHGRYGITMFAISGVDIALWDLAGKRAGQPVYELLMAQAPRGDGGGGGGGGGGGAGSPQRRDFRTYASLMRYDDVSLVARTCEAALAQGYTAVKMHEREPASIAAGREAVGIDVPLATDVNCGYTAEYVAEQRAALEGLGLAWLEEPIFPPEDYAALAALRSPELRIAAGENWCTSLQFQRAGEVGAVDIMQPSVTKVGGISEFLRAADVAAAFGLPVIPHCPYYGPGFHATLHAAAARPGVDDVEMLWVAPEAWLADVQSLRSGDRVRVPDGPGLGFEPDLDVIARYRRE
jgi:L-alanine-DL-glutamate epimerase-like enolase superfamily enzyme